MPCLSSRKWTSSNQAFVTEGTRRQALLRFIKETLKRRGVICSVAILTYPHISGGLLEYEATMGHWLVRLVVARHPNAPPEVVAALARDGIDLDSYLKRGDDFWKIEVRESN